MKKTDSQTYYIGAVCVAVSAVLFSSKAIFIKKAFAVTEITPVGLMVLRMACSIPLLWLIVGFEKMHKKSNKTPLSPKDWRDILIVGTTGYYLASLFDFKGLMFISVGLERILLYLYPTFVVVFGAVFLGHRIGVRLLAPLALCYIGVMLAFAGEITERGWANIKGVVYVVLSALMFSIFVLCSGRVIARIGGTRFSAYAMSVSTLAILMHFLATHNLHAWEVYKSALPLGIILAVFSTVVPVNLMAAGLTRVGPNHFAVISCVGPMATMVMGWVFLGEASTAFEWAGLMIVVVGGMLLALFKTRPEIKKRLV